METRRLRGRGTPPCGTAAHDRLLANFVHVHLRTRRIEVRTASANASTYLIESFPAARSLHPRLTRGFLEYSQHRGFISTLLGCAMGQAPRGAWSAGGGLFKGGEFTRPSRNEVCCYRWCLEVAGQRIHGTTRKQSLPVRPGHTTRRVGGPTPRHVPSNPDHPCATRRCDSPIPQPDESKVHPGARSPDYPGHPQSAGADRRGGEVATARCHGARGTVEDEYSTTRALSEGDDVPPRHRRPRRPPCRVDMGNVG